MSRFRYSGRSDDTVSKRASQKGGDFDSIFKDGVKTIKPKEGENNYRILPGGASMKPPTWEVKKWGDNWGIEIWIHGSIGSDNGMYLCPDKMKGKRCPICEAIDDLDDDMKKKVKARKRILCYVVDRENEKEGPFVWNLGWKLERDIQKRSQDKRSGEVLLIDHPDEGYDISFEREGTKLNTEYTNETIARSPSPISERPARQEKWLQFIADNPLPSLLHFYTADYIEGVFMGKKDGDDEDEDRRPRRGKARDDDDDDEDRPRSRKSKRASSREDDSDDDEDSDDDDDERPRRKKKSRDRDEDDEDKDSDDEDEDEIPDRKQMKRNKKRAQGKSSDDDEEDDEDEKPSKKSKRPRDDDEDDDEDEKPRKKSKHPRDEDDEEDDEDEKPSKKSKRPRDDDEDDEEDEKPRKKSKRPSDEDEEDDDEEDDEEDVKKVTSRAKKSLDHLKSRRRR